MFAQVNRLKIYDSRRLLVTLGSSLGPSTAQTHPPQPTTLHLNPPHLTLPHINQPQINQPPPRSHHSKPSYHATTARHHSIPPQHTTTVHHHTMPSQNTITAHHHSTPPHHVMHFHNSLMCIVQLSTTISSSTKPPKCSFSSETMAE